MPVMKAFHLVPAILIVGAAALAAGQESAPVASAHVTARLVTENEGIVPGKPFTVALRLEMEKGWHTYTDPAGDAGMPTKIAWTLPEGFKAGKIQWPEAHDFNLGPLKTRGYDGTVVLPVTITPPDKLQPGQTVRIAAKAEWLACEVAWVPGSADLALDLPVISGVPPPGTSGADVAPGTNPIGVSGMSGVFAAMFFAFVGELILNRKLPVSWKLRTAQRAALSLFQRWMEPIVMPELLTREAVLSTLNTPRVSRAQNEVKTNEKPGGNSS